MKEVFVRTKEKQYGPMSEHDFRRMISDGRLSKDDLVWHYYKNIWVEIGKIERFRELFESNGRKKQNKKLIAIGSGKGGVGKTALTVSMGAQLASLGKKVVLVDADFSSPNLHQWMGISHPTVSLHSFFTQNITNLEDVVIETSERNLKLVCGAIGNLSLANLRHFQTLKFLKSLRDLDADFILIDLGPGSSFKMIDLFLASDESILVTVPETTAIVDAYNFLKLCILRHMKRSVKFSSKATQVLERLETSQTGLIKHSLKPALAEIQNVDDRAYSICLGVLRSFTPKFVLNMVFNKNEDKEGYLFATAMAKLLTLHVEYLGYIEYNYNAREAAKTVGPFYLAGANFNRSMSLSDFSTINSQNHQVTNSRNWRRAVKNLRFFESSSTIGNSLFGEVLDSMDMYQPAQNYF